MGNNRSVNLAFEIESGKSPKTSGVDRILVNDGRMTVRGKITTAIIFFFVAVVSVLLLKCIQIGDTAMFAIMLAMLLSLSVLSHAYAAEIAELSFAQGKEFASRVSAESRDAMPRRNESPSKWDVADEPDFSECDE